MTPCSHRMRCGLGRPPRAQSQGAALLMALIIVTLVATLAASMVWQQWRSVQVETAERARAQSAWILAGALDWARIILREDGRASGGGTDHLGEPWAVPLAEARLSTFLAVDPNNADDAPDTFLSGSISDAQARYNLRNLIQDSRNSSGGRNTHAANLNGTVVKAELEILQRLCRILNVKDSVATQIAHGLRDAGAGNIVPPPAGANIENPPLMPSRFEQLAWLGVDAESLKRLEPYVFLPPPGKPATPINVNTASREVLAAVIPNLGLGMAERLTQSRDRAPFKQREDVEAVLGDIVLPGPSHLGFSTRYFFVRGRLRLSNQVLEQRSLVQRTGLEVVPVTREWVNSSDPG